VQRRGSCNIEERQRSVVGENVVWTGAEIRYGHPQRIAHADPSGVGELPQVERTIVEDAVIAANELHEARDGAVAVVDDAGVVAGEERTAGDRAIGQGADAAIIGQGRGANGRTEDNASGR